MCLFSTQAEPKIAQQDIVCYKVMQRYICYSEYHKEKQYVLETPFQSIFIEELPYTMDDTYKEINYGDGPTPENVNNYDVFRIEGGAIHCLLKINKKTLSKMTWSGSFWLPVVFVKCIIPKGIEYWEGIYGDICAKKVTLLEIVPYENIKKKLHPKDNRYVELRSSDLLMFKLLCDDDIQHLNRELCHKEE